jgi:sialate O-acetylesterase
MEFAMSQVENAATEIAAASHPNIRFMRVQHRPADYPRSDVPVDQSWVACDPQSAPHFSAVAYYFAREIEQHQHVPIGIIETNWGGTVAEAWTSMHALSGDASLMPVFRAWANMQENEEELVMQDHNDAELRKNGKPVPHREWHPELHSWAPSELFNGMIAPFTPYPIRGAIWYQGESNSRLDRKDIYRLLFPAMIRDWRAQWRQGDFPFLFVQISSFGSGLGEEWPLIREAQRETLGLANTAMAVTTDIGDPGDVHPKNKKDVGHRLALPARAIVYGEKVEYSGPTFRKATPEGNRVRLWFDHASSGLVAKSGELRALEIAGEDGKFVSASAIIEGSTIVLSSDQVGRPLAVRYNWRNAPDGNLFNGEGLPASAFRGEVK